MSIPGNIKISIKMLWVLFILKKKKRKALKKQERSHIQLLVGPALDIVGSVASCDSESSDVSPKHLSFSLHYFRIIIHKLCKYMFFSEIRFKDARYTF